MKWRSVLVFAAVSVFLLLIGTCSVTACYWIGHGLGH